MENRLIEIIRLYRICEVRNRQSNTNPLQYIYERLHEEKFSKIFYLPILLIIFFTWLV
jgi:hypothetical protein